LRETGEVKFSVSNQFHSLKISNTISPISPRRNLILGFVMTPILYLMKLDLIAIRKLSPATLWDLAQLTALISTLLSVISCGFCDAATVRLSGRMLKQYRRELHERALDNYNMRIKAWVMQCPNRIAYVRSIIGETAIKTWRKNRLLDYAFTQTFGDWQDAFPHGLKRKDKAPNQKITRKFTRKSTRNFRAYVWKPFALVKIANAERILFGQEVTRLAHSAKAQIKDLQAATFKLWNVDIADTSGGEKSTQPREPRAMNPVRFRPHELVSEAATGMPEDVVETTKSVDDEPEIFPPPKTDLQLTQSTSAQIKPMGMEAKPP